MLIQHGGLVQLRSLSAGFIALPGEESYVRAGTDAFAVFSIPRSVLLLSVNHCPSKT